MFTCCGAGRKRIPTLIDGEPCDDTTVKRLAAAGTLPVFAIPKVDLAGDNGIKQVFMAEYEGGVELTVIFDDEDRPDAVSDFIYDMIRMPLFGRSEDIESIFVECKANPMKVESIEFPGTYSDGADWAAAAPLHGHATVPIGKFERRELGKASPRKSRLFGAADTGPLIWINTWSHLFGETNANPKMEMVFCTVAAAADAAEHNARGVALPADLYPLYHGSRAEVDAKFKGLVGSFAKTMDEEKMQRIGKRVEPTAQIKVEPLV